MPARPTGTGNGREQIIPGSALHGAVRSLHETLTGSCLRVFDAEFIPTYRQQAEVKQIQQLRLGLVTAAATESTPPTVQLCEDHGRDNERIDQPALVRLHATTPGGLRSGARLHRHPDGTWTVAPDGDWVVFISDDGARDHSRRYRAAVRELTEERVTIPEQVWRDFLHAVEDADDLRPERLKQDGGEHERWKEVVYEYAPKGQQGRPYPVGMRSLARRTVEYGQPLWLRFENDTITELRLAQIWRMPGRIAAKDRIGGFMPCTDPEQSLCPACRLFGSADVSGTDGGPATQRSYRGHVRFSDAVVCAPATTQAVTLPPLGRPRPGAGQFYLENSADLVGDAARPVPLRQWGSPVAESESAPRRLRGRKFYWHTPPPPGELPVRGRARSPKDEDQKTDTNMISSATLYPADTRFTATVTFVDIDEAQLGALLAALDPADLLGTPDLLVHVGGGQPLGYGSCTINVSEHDSTVWRSEQRYSAGRQEPLTTLRATATEALRAAHPALRRTWEYLAAVLSPQTVAGQLVWYPPGKGTVGRDKTFDEGYEFWKQTAGYELAPAAERPTEHRGFPLTPLPDALDRVQTMEIVVEAAKRRLGS